VLLYDDGCRLCRWAARVVARFDRGETFALLPLGDAAAAQALATVPADARNGRWWLVLRDGSAVPGDAGGGVAALGEATLTRPLARGLRVARASPIVDALDRFAARHRGKIGRLVPDGPAPRRYP